MSLVNLGNMCCHLQNVTMVRSTLTSVPYSKMNLQISYNLYKHGFLTSLQRGSTKGPDFEYTEVTPDNISTRRLWVGLKYRNNQPVLSKISLISKPNLHIQLNHTDLLKVCKGLTVRKIKPLQPGELILVQHKGIVMEINEAIAKKKDNCLVLLRAK
ncbi:37S ribosomal protein S8, mitochondrial [Hanseniaspora vineae]